MCWPQQTRKHSINLYIPRHCTEPAMYTSAERLNEDVFAMVGAAMMSLV